MRGREVSLEALTPGQKGLGGRRNEGTRLTSQPTEGLLVTLKHRQGFALTSTGFPELLGALLTAGATPPSLGEA